MAALIVMVALLMADTVPLLINVLLPLGKMVNVLVERSAWIVPLLTMVLVIAPLLARKPYQIPPPLPPRIVVPAENVSVLPPVFSVLM